MRTAVSTRLVTAARSLVSATGSGRARLGVIEIKRHKTMVNRGMTPNNLLAAVCRTTLIGLRMKLQMLHKGSSQAVLVSACQYKGLKALNAVVTMHQTLLLAQSMQVL